MSAIALPAVFSHEKTRNLPIQRSPLFRQQPPRARPLHTILKTKMDKTTKIKIYFYSILGIGLVWTLFVPKPYKNFAPIFFGLLTFPVFGFLFYKQFYDFSNVLKRTHSDLFQKYILNYGISINRGEIIDIWSLFNNKDFDVLKFDCKQRVQLS